MTMRLPSAIFLLLCGCYLLMLSGHTYSADEETMLAVTRGLIERGDVAVVVAEGAPVAALRPGRDGGSYSPYGVLPSLLAVPLHLGGAVLAPAGPAADYTTRFAVTALNALLTAAVGAVLAAWALRLGAPPAWATVLALLYGLATFAWPYARTFFSEPLAALLILVAAERAHAAQQRSHPATQRRALFIAGLAAGLLLATRIAAGVALPVLGLYVLWGAWQGRPATSSWLRSAFAVLRAPLPWLAGLLPGLALLVWYNLARFGTPLASGYASEAGLFTTPLLVGLHGLLLSPGKSVLLYAPPLLLALPGAVALWRRGAQATVLLALGLFLSHLLLYARWGEWPGGGVWGPRFLLPVVAPVLVLAAGFVPLRPGATARPGWRLLVVALLAVAGFAGNLGGVLFNFSTYVVTTTPSDKLYSLAGSPLVGHWRLLGERWASYAAAPPVCRPGDGFFASEDPGGAPLPRRSGALGVLHCHVSAGTRIAFRLDDRRPPAAPPSDLRLRLDGRELAAPPAGQLRAYQLLLPPGRARLAIVAHPWNPLAVGFSERDDELGPQLADLGGSTRDGAQLAVVDTGVAPLPLRPRPRWAWYYDPPNRHLVDHWAWYLPRSELSGPRAWLLGGLLVVLGTGALVAGSRLTRRAVRGEGVIPILLAGIALAQLHTSTALQLYKALCGAGELWR
ncbi:MAG: hypothetical protein HXY37_01395 [Chloroflexi bacterium]|nr:hypothetical protein [Chloroflexota bacterium]